MALFRKPVITKIGLNLISNTEIGGSNMQFTNIRTSDFKYPNDTDFELLEQLEGIKQTIPIQSAEVVNNENVRVIGVLSNEDLNDGYFIQSIGFYVKDTKNNKEILYAVINAENPDFFPEKKPTEDTQRITIVGNITASNVQSATVEVDAQTVYTTQYEFNLLKESYNPQDVLEKLKTVDGHGSGLDADLLDSYHAESFIFKNPTKVNSRQQITKSGLYYMSKSDATDLPVSGHDFIMLAMKNNLDITVIAVSTSDSDCMYTDCGHSNDGGKTFQWQNWKKSNDNADAQKLKGIVPIKSGGTGSSNILDALKNLKLKNDSVFKEPYSAMLNAGKFANTSSQSMTMLEFAFSMPLNTSVIFTNATNETPCITDTPTIFGEIILINGYTKNYKYALYFDCTTAENKNIYYWAARDYKVEKNWVKINDGGNADTVDGKHANEFATAAQGTKADNALPAASYTASDVLAKLKTVDGAGSGVDADLLDGKQASAFATSAQGTKADNALPASSYTASDVLAKLKTVDGTNSGLDADLLDGKQASAFATAAQGTKADNALPATSYTASDVLAKLKTVDGINSGLDADLLDGKQASAFATAAQGTKADNALPATSYTANDILTKLKTVDGSNSGLDADLLNGKQLSEIQNFNNLTNKPTLQDILNNSPSDEELIVEFTGVVVVVDSETIGIVANRVVENEISKGTIIEYTHGGNKYQFTAERVSGPEIYTTATSNLLVLATSGGQTVNFKAIIKKNVIEKVSDIITKSEYTASDVLTKLKTVDGANSGLDADLLDGKQASAFATAAQGTKADNALPAASYTANDILTKLKTVDGSGSGLDADLLDGKQASAFATSAQGTKADNALPAASYTANDILTKLKTVDGSGSGLDADLLDGKQASEIQNYKNLTNKPNFQDILNNSPINQTVRIEFTGTVQVASSFASITTTYPVSSNMSDGQTVYYSYNGTKSCIANSFTRSGFMTDSNKDFVELAASGQTVNFWADVNEPITQKVSDFMMKSDFKASEFATSAQGTKADNALPKSSYTASDILAKLKTVDGAGSGLDADLLDGYQINRFVLGEVGHGYTVSWKTRDSEMALEFKVDNTENLPVRKSLEANSLQGKKASDFMPITGGASTGTISVPKLILQNNDKLFVDFNGDAADINKSNVRIGTWYGFGVAPSYAHTGGVPLGKNAFWVDARTGNTYTYSQFYANQGQDLVLNTGNKKAQGVPYYSATAPTSALPAGYTVMIPE